MSVEAMTWAFQVPLPPCPKSVLVALANRADEDGYCWPGLDDLELRTGWKRRSIQEALRHLEMHGLLCISPRYTEIGQQTSNLYRLTMAPTPCGEGAPHAPMGVRQVRGEGAPHAPMGVRQVRGEGAPHAPLGVRQVRGEGAPHAPKSSSEQSVEQSVEQSPLQPPQGGVMSVEFERWWACYPKKVGKKAAWAAWQKARDRPGLDAMLAAVAQAMRTEQWRRGFVPNPATWLHQGRWADEVAVGVPVARPRTMVDLLAMGGSA